MSIDEVAAKLDRSRKTVRDYLVDYLRRNDVREPTAWVDPKLFARIAAAADEVGAERLKPIFEKLGGEVDYDTIAVAVACIQHAGLSEES
jgi:ATP-dependent DNA helicase RecQ